VARELGESGLVNDWRNGLLQFFVSLRISIRYAEHYSGSVPPGALEKDVMDRLWAPWRLSYVAADKPPAAADPCFICRGLAEQSDRQNLIVLRTPRSVVLLNRFPYNNGHLLVAPLAHKGHLAHLEADEMQETMSTLQRMLIVLDELMHPDGYNVGLNQGSAAGAGLPGHLHWHIVPRWHGDTNFMPILGDVKVIVQSLDALYEILAGRLKQ
jgi:ATP adenylyltransferase